MRQRYARAASDSMDELSRYCRQIVTWNWQHERVRTARREPMSFLDPDLDEQMSQLQLEWRQAYESGIVARSYYQTLAANEQMNTELLDMARERLDRTVVLKAQIMAKIERIEDKMLARISPWRAPSISAG
jgi:hypothetical protein